MHRPDLPTTPRAVPDGVVSRIRSELRSNGPRAAARRIAGGVRQQLRLDETHLWYELPTGGDRPRVDLPEGFVLRRAGADQLPLLEQLPTILVAEGAGRLATGNDLWLVLEEQRAAFACWTFRSSMPLLGAPGGELSLAPGTVFVEDSVTAPEYRGRRLGPAAWTLVADELAAEGVTTLLTRIAEDNVPTQKSVLKSGFRQVARVRHQRVLGRSRMTVADPVGPQGAHLRELFG